jgi:tetratricopeptide (TPR) repeat protein
VQENVTRIDPHAQTTTGQRSSSSLGTPWPEQGLRHAAVHAAEQAWGPEHPHTADFLYDLGEALLDHDPTAARAALERAIEIWTLAHTEPHPNLAWAHLALASLAFESDALDEAEQHARTCASIQAQTLAPDDPLRGNPHNLLSHIASMRGDSREALAHSLVALEYYQREGETETVTQLRYEVPTRLPPRTRSN